MHSSEQHPVETAVIKHNNDDNRKHNFEGYNAAARLNVCVLILNVGKGRQTISTIILLSSSTYYDYTLETSSYTCTY